MMAVNFWTMPASQSPSRLPKALREAPDSPTSYFSDLHEE
jgi:hypothetical protein